MGINLKEEREKQGYSIEEVAEKLRIRKQYIIALEEEDYENLPGSTYIEGYIKNYCNFLKISPPKKENCAKLVSIPISENCRTGKYIIAAISLLLLLLSIILYQKYGKSRGAEEVNIDSDLIYLEDGSE